MKEVLQKTTFRICSDSVNVGAILTCFLMASGTILMTFGASSETVLKFHDFRWLSKGAPELRAPCWLVVFWLVPGLIAVTKQYGVALQHAKYIIEPEGIKGYEKTRMQLTKILKIKAAI